MRRIVSRMIAGVDDVLARHCVPRRDHPKLLTLCGHSVHHSREELAGELMHPQQRLLDAELRAVLECLLGLGYRFVRPDELGGGLAADGRYAILTFDDGYFNNLSVLDMLQELSVPAVFFVVPVNIERGQSYWWDAVYRKGRRQGRSLDAIEAFIAEIKQTPPAKIPAFLAAGGITSSDLRPVSDLDRPMRRDELVELARHPWAVIGNHTHSHEILTVCTAPEMRQTLREAQEYLQRTCGALPTAIAYPNGSYSSETMLAAREVGLRWGFTLDPHWDGVPVADDDQLRLGRFLVWGERDPAAQCNRARLRYSATALVSRVRRSFATRRGARNGV